MVLYSSQRQFYTCNNSDFTTQSVEQSVLHLAILATGQFKTTTNTDASSAFFGVFDAIPMLKISTM